MNSNHFFEANASFFVLPKNVEQYERLLKKLIQAGEQVPLEEDTFSFVWVDCRNGEINTLPSNFHENIIHKNYIHDILGNHFATVQGKDCPFNYLADWTTIKMGKVWAPRAITTGGFSFHDDVIIVGEKTKNGYKCLNFCELASALLSITETVNYSTVGIGSLMPRKIIKEFF
jgi:hypothetical protein